MSKQRSLCEICWREASARFRLEQDQPRAKKTRHEHYTEVLKEMGSHEDGHPENREAPVDDILEVPLPDGEDYPNYVLVRQAGHARVYVYPPGDDVGRLLVELRDALEWCWQHAWQGDSSFQAEMVERGILVEVPASEEYKLQFDTDTMLVPAWKRDE
ncbi:MAG: hypothetical protein V3T24_02930 [Longimicrobiales bacterium]